MERVLSGRVRLGRFEFDLKSRELRSARRTIILPEKPFRILSILVENDSELVSRDEIQKKLWPNDTIVDFEHGINTAMNRLREALGDSADQPKYIETIPRCGYRLLVAVERLDAATDHSSSPDGNGVAPVRTPDREQSPANPSSIVSAPPKTSDSNLIGKKVSHYRALEVIGAGGMGLVYRAEDVKLGRQVALKFLPEDLALDSVALQRFEREAQTASSLDHPNICTIYEVEEHEGQPFIVMQLLQGETLRDRLARLAAERKTLPLKELLDIAIHISSGLEAAHAKGIIHRDIKPANIFLTSSGQVKILDFGLAKAVSIAQEAGNDGGVPLEADAGSPAAPKLARSAMPDATLTRFGVAIGTAGYMSPEQIRGDQLDARTDIFSFGLVLYEMATGKRAFTGVTEAAVHDEILNSQQPPIREVSPGFPAALAYIIERCLEKERSQRIQTASDICHELAVLQRESALGAVPVLSPPRRARRFHRAWVVAPVAVVVSAIVVAGIFYWLLSHKAKITSEDTIVLGVVKNATADPIFNDTLNSALAVAVGQTPYLSPLSGEKVSQVLTLMNHAPDEPLTPALAQQVCAGTNSAAYVTGSIADIGNQYRIELSAAECKTGNTLVDVSVTANDRNQVVASLGEAVVTMRRKLGEPAETLERYNKPLPEATTASIEALHAYSVASTFFNRPEAGAEFTRATQIDPDFALAYNLRGTYYHNVGRPKEEAENLTKGYRLRGRLTRRDGLTVETSYYIHVTGEYEKAVATAEQAIQEFPRFGRPRLLLGYTLGLLGQHKESVTIKQEALRVLPEAGSAYSTLAESYIVLNRLQDAKTVLDQAAARHIDTPKARRARYLIAFLLQDQKNMDEQVRWVATNPGLGDFVLNEQSEVEAYYGRLQKADSLSQRVAKTAMGAEATEKDADGISRAALHELRIGHLTKARELAASVQPANVSVASRVAAAQVFAAVGESTRAQELAQEVSREYPRHMLVQGCLLPAVRAELFLQQRNAAAAIRAIELAIPQQYPDACGPESAYTLGLAYLDAGEAQQAAAQFTKILQSPGLAANSGNLMISALARLQLGRAQAMIGKSDARQSYQEFLTLWKDADPDLPLLKQAKSEYAKLK